MLEDSDALVEYSVENVVRAGRLEYVGHFEIAHRLVVGSRSLGHDTWEGRPVETRKGRWHAFMSHEQELTVADEAHGGRARFVSEVTVCHESVLPVFHEQYERATEVGEVAVHGSHVTLMDSAVFDESALAASVLATGDSAIAGHDACVIRCHAPGYYPLYIWMEEGLATFVSLSLM